MTRTSSKPGGALDANLLAGGGQLGALERSARRSICFVLDLSGRKAVEQARQNFLANVSQELRNPLSSIRG